MKRGTVFSVVFSIIGVVISLSLFASEKNLMDLCSKHCWINGLLLSLFGNKIGKNIISIAILMVSFLPIYFIFSRKEQP
jgi:hypothetical protein